MEKISQVKNDTLQVKYNGKQIKINLTDELSINESLLNSQLRESPSNYAFLCTLKDKAIRKRDKLEREKDRIFSELWLFFKNSNSKLSNEYATHQANQNKKFKAAEDRYLRAAYEASRLISICRAYESRESVLRSLNANIRLEKQPL